MAGAGRLCRRRRRWFYGVHAADDQRVDGGDHRAGGRDADNPNNAAILTLAASGNGLHGNVDECYRCNMRAYELSPDGPEAYQTLQGLGAAEMMRGNHEAAIEWCLKSLATFNGWFYTYLTLACSYAALDRMDDARAMLRQVREIMPDLTLKAIEDGADDEDAFAWAVLPWLRKAGLPEG